MTDQTNGRRGVLVYAVVVMAGVTAVSLVLRSMNLSVADRSAAAFIMAAMWTPALGRFAATRTVDRAWQSPFPLRRWGDRKYGVMLIPLVTVSVIYLGAYGLAWLTGVPRATPVWEGIALAINVVVNLPLLAAFDVIGGLGEELGWRGYLQPRLDEMGVRGSLLWVIGLETLFHTPLILLAGYLPDASWATFALFLGLGLGATPVWTWATYRWGTIWIAAWFHSFHNAISQVFVPKALGEGDPRLLGESGVFPVALYLLVAGAVLGITRAQGKRWREFAQDALTAAKRGEAAPG